MYSEWLSLTETVKQPRLADNVLRTFPQERAQEVVASVIKPLKEMSLGRNYNMLATPEQVNWTMQVIGYGLTLPLSHMELLGNCSDVYREWLTTLGLRKRTVPLPISNQPDHYAQVIFDQLCVLFVPRENEKHLLEGHALICKNVIDSVGSLMMVKKLKMSRDTWTTLLSFLLHVCDILLSPPPKTPSLGTSLCDELINTLFATWLKACHVVFPGPTMWKTLQEFCATWRHQTSLINQWCQLMMSLTKKVAFVLYGSKHYKEIASTTDVDKRFRFLLEGMPKDAVVQCWFRMLHTLKNPMDLLYQELITDTRGFKEAIAEAELATPGSSLRLIQSTKESLPKIFYSLMKGVTAQVFLFLGKKQEVHTSRLTSLTAAKGAQQRKDSTPTSPQSHTSTTESYYINLSAEPSNTVPFSSQEEMSSSDGIIGKPKGNTLLHVFGDWLFEAAIWTGQDSEGFPSRGGQHSSTTIISSTADLTRINESAPPVTTQLHRVKEYEAGRAEAFTALCTIFSSQECGESVIPTYLARFYHALLVGLQYDPHNYTGEVLTRIILHCAGLLRKDLPGINMLMPYFISALDKILPSKKPQIYCDVPSQKLRYASIQLLVSMLALPLHFVHLPLPDVSLIIHSSMESVRGHFPYQSVERRTSSSSSSLPPTFYSMKNQLVVLLFAAIETEEDDTNMEMLLHGLMVYIQDLVSYERMLTAMTGEYQPGKPDYDTTTEDENAERPFTSDFSPTVIFQKAITAASGVLLSSANSPTTRNSVILAALELLTGLARLQFDAFSHNECREAVQSVCDFIESQAQQKPYLQTKQLHTSIVAAFQTLLVWILEHPHLLAHEGCLRAILRVAEFGVSGSFSLENDGSTIYKGEKQLKPISGRVGEIAEFVLQNLMEKTGSFPFPCGPASSSSLLTEEEVLKNLQKQGKFQYFLVDNSFILGLLEHPNASSNEENCLPTVSTIVRGPSGRQVWSMQLRHHPRDAKPTQSHLKSMERPSICEDSTTSQLHNWSPWPQEASQQTGLKLEDSIPVLGEVLNKSPSNLHEEFSILTEQQIEVARNVNAELQQARAKVTFPDPDTAQEPPETKKVISTARLLLGHLGLLNVDSFPETQLINGQASLALLDSSCSSFRNALVSLDRMPARFCNTVFVFYCQKGVSKVEDIFANQTLSGKPQEFIKFLGSLGWEVDPVKHPGFSGRIHSSTAGEGRPVHLSAQIPLRPFPYYADAMHEVAFVLPVLKPSASDSSSSVRSLESSDSGQESPAVASEPVLPPISIPTWSSPSGSGVQESSVYAGVVEQEKQSTLGRMGVKCSVASQFGKAGTYADSMDTPKRRSSVIQDCAAIVVWLEKFEDYLQFPAESLSRMLHKGTGKSSKTGTNVLPVIFIHRLASGLYQTVIKAEERGGPLIDGMVVSWRCLGALVRQTTINLCSRHRMNNEGFSPPHVKRKKRIEEIGAAFSKSSTVASLYSDLLLDKQ